jgi:hypothetical protein
MAAIVAESLTFASLINPPDATPHFSRSQAGAIDSKSTSLFHKEPHMPRGDKSKYTDKQERQAEHIEEGYEKRGLPEKEAKRRAWATVNKVHKGGEKPGGGGYGKPEDHSPMHKGGQHGGAAAASRPKAARSASAKKAAQTRKARGR